MITGKLNADFDDFNKAARQATAELKEMESQSKSMATSLTEVSPKQVEQVTQATQDLGMAGRITDKVMADLTGKFVAWFTVDAVLKYIGAIAETASVTKDLAEATGMSYDQIQKLNYVAAQSGTTLDTLAGGAQTLSQRLGDNNSGAVGALRQLGINVEEFKQLDPYERLIKISEAFGSIDERTKLASLAFDLFGGKGKEMLPALKSNMDEVAAAAPKMAEASISALNRMGERITWLKSLALAKGGNALGGLIESLETTPVTKSEDLGQIGQEIDAARLKDFNDTLAALKPLAEKAVDGLKPLTLSEQEFAKATADAKADLERHNKEVAAAEAYALKFAGAMEELNSAGGSWQDTLAGISGDTVGAIEWALKAGVSQSTLATAYGLTATQVKAVASGMADKQEVMKQETSATNALMDLQVRYGQVVRDASGKTMQAQIDNAWAAADAQILAAQKAGTLSVDAYDLIYKTAAQTAANIKSNRLEEDAGTKSHYDKLAKAAQEYYDFALKNSGEYTTERIEQLRLESEKAKEALRNWGQAAAQTMEEVVTPAKQAVEWLDYVTDRMARLQKATFVGEGMPSSESLDLAALNPGSMLGLGGGRNPNLEPLSTMLAPWQPSQAMVNNFTINYPIMDDPTAMDKLGRLVGDAVMSRVTRGGAVT